MVKGLEKFREYFKEYSGSYVIIGGTAAAMLMERSGFRPRETKDIDAILIIEALDKAFGRRFWDFVHDGSYAHRMMSSGKTQYYRFYKPGNRDFPDILELFSRKPDIIELPAGFHLTPVPLEDELSSLSAILLDDHYYHYSVNHTVELDGLNLVNADALVVLKAKAYINNTERSRNGEKVRSEDIRKHKNDIYRTLITLPLDTRYDIPEEIREDLRSFLAMVQTDGIGTRDICDILGLPEITLENFIVQFKLVFGI